jgi:hypothetical protein
MSLVSTVSVGSGGASSIEFTSIPQDGTDLLVLISARNSANTNTATMSFNTGGSYTSMRLFGTGSSASSNTPRVDFNSNPSAYTSNTFASSGIYIPNYTSSNSKNYSSDSASENNNTATSLQIYAGSWSETSAITMITLTAGSGGTFDQHTVASLYKITSGSDGITSVS